MDWRDLPDEHSLEDHMQSVEDTYVKAGERPDPQGYLSDLESVVCPTDSCGREMIRELIHSDSAYKKPGHGVARIFCFDSLFVGTGHDKDGYVYWLEGWDIQAREEETFESTFANADPRVSISYGIHTLSTHLDFDLSDLPVTAMPEPDYVRIN